MLLQINLQVRQLKEVCSVSRPLPRYRANARKKLIEVKRLYKIVVSSQVKPLNSVRYRVPCRKQEHRCIIALIPQLL